MPAFIPSTSFCPRNNCAWPKNHIKRQKRYFQPRITRCVAEPPTTPDYVRELITSKGKKEQQKGLLLVRKLPPETALDLLLLCVETSTNEFIRSSATIAIGQLSFETSSMRDTALFAMVRLLATDSEYSVRSAAAAGMGYVEGVDNNTVAVLIEALCRALLEDSEWQVKFSCLAALGSLRSGKAIPTVKSYLDNDNDLLVQAAVGALGDIGDSKVVPDLLKLLGANDMMTRQRLAQALKNINGAREEPAVIDALRILSKDQSFAVREAASSVLSDFGCADAAKTETMTEEEKLDFEVASLLEGDEGKNAGASASEALRRRLERSFDKQYVPEKQTVVEESVAAGPEGEMKEQSTASEEEFQNLVHDLKHGNNLEQTVAGIRLRKFDGKRVANEVIQSSSLEPEVSSIRLRSICVGLLALGKEFDKIIEILHNDPDQNVRSACCDALGDFDGGEKAVKACIGRFKMDEHWLVRISAAISLGSIAKGSSEAETELIESLKPNGVKGMNPPQDSVIQRHAVTALGFLGSKKSVSAFRDLLESENADSALRFRIAGALRGIRCDESAKLARVLINDGDNEISEMAQGTLDALAKDGFS